MRMRLHTETRPKSSRSRLLTLTLLSLLSTTCSYILIHSNILRQWTQKL